jgi:hypothetical protein
MQVSACADELRLIRGERGSTLSGESGAVEDSASTARNLSSAWAPPVIVRMWRGAYGERVNWTMHLVVRGGRCRARRCARVSRFTETNG